VAGGVLETLELEAALEDRLDELFDVSELDEELLEAAELPDELDELAREDEADEASEDEEDDPMPDGVLGEESPPPPPPQPTSNKTLVRVETKTMARMTVIQSP
jgi:hypothetical protein